MCRRHFRLEEKAKRKARELADLIRAWEQGEQERLGRLQAIAQARQDHAERSTTHEQQILQMQGELATLNEQKGKLFAQLKQVSA